MTRILNVLPPINNFCTAWDNMSGAEKNLDKLLERLCLKDRLNKSELLSGYAFPNGLRNQVKQIYKKHQL